ncbi:MAG: HlyD family efflux transporter periplasmic adaptor subunit [Bacteroidetes bacterium]|nr:HlyD family efflux transporter periplasmic adaptor subunit [Bacteroidota bacterium]
MKGSNFSLIISILAIAIGCNHQEAAPAEEQAKADDVKTPVTLTNIERLTFYDSIGLNATSVFLQNSYVKSTATGYVKSVTIKPGDYVNSGKILFTIETKESQVIGNSISSLDTSFRFSGVNTIKASVTGFITQLDHQPGDYVQDGDQLAVVSDMNSFAFLLNLPYELRPFVLNKKTVNLTLPDGTHLQGNIASVMPTVDSLSQTQPVVIKVSSQNPIPQNLIAKVNVIKTIRNNVATLPKSAVLSDEAQTKFWIMKMIDSITAVKVDIKKGIELNGKVEIMEPAFSPKDQILLTGNYGLPDTAKVIIEKQ